MRWDSDTGHGPDGLAARRRPGRKPRHGSASRGGAQLFALFFLSVVLLILSRLDHDLLHKVRETSADIAAPVLEAVSVPVRYARRSFENASSYMDVFDEVERLKAENQSLKNWEWQAKRLEHRLNHMRALLNAVEEPALAFTTARVIAEARGPFVRSVLVNVGQEQGVKPGYAVINAAGLVGRVVHVGDTAARVVLLNDLNSRVPVLVGPSAVRAVLAGDNAEMPRLEFLPDAARIYAGDEVYTSGDDGLLPRGLRIGTVASDPQTKPVVRPYAQFDDLEYVSVLFFDAPSVPTVEPVQQPLSTAVPQPTKRSAVEADRAPAR